MAHLIDKSALVAEMERRRDDYINSFMTEQVHMLNDVLDFINSLEVKEVDLEKEIASVEDKYYGFESLSRADVIEIIKHFFELGLKVQKGEEV